MNEDEITAMSVPGLVAIVMKDIQRFIALHAEILPSEEVQEKLLTIEVAIRTLQKHEQLEGIKNERHGEPPSALQGRRD
jgi:hypothetical protein